MRKWLDGARAAGGLSIPGGPDGAVADLLIAPAAVWARAADASVRLDWTDLATPGEAGGLDAGVPAPPGGRWWVSWWTAGRGGTTGAGLAVAGACAEEATPVLRATRSFWNRLQRWGEPLPRVPLWTGAVTQFGGDRERPTVAALCRLLGERPELRARLDDEGRVARLAADLRAGALDAVPLAGGLRRSTFEVLAALRAEGFVHHLDGRPVPGDDDPGPDAVVERVLAHLRDNPFTAGLELDLDTVTDVVRRHHTGVAPWPFGALTRP